MSVRTITVSAEDMREAMANPALEVDHYRIDEHHENKCVRIVMMSKDNRVVSWFVIDAEDCYEFAAEMLRKYDKLMGLDQQ